MHASFMGFGAISDCTCCYMHNIFQLFYRNLSLYILVSEIASISKIVYSEMILHTELKEKVAVVARHAVLALRPIVERLTWFR